MHRSTSSGDNKTDIGIVRPLNAAEWWINRSSTGLTFALQFGAGTDLIVPADYTAIFRPSQATWYVQRSTAGILIQQFGANGDRPIPNAFVP